MLIRRVDIVFGTRPEAIKMAMVCKIFKSSSVFETRIISTGQHKQMLSPILEWFEIVPDVDLSLMEPNQTLSGITASCISKLQSFYDSFGRSDLVLVQGDTATAFASALTAFYNKIKIGHIEAGLRTNNRQSPWPEEMNRVLLSRLADYHFAPTANNVKNLLNESVRSDYIFETGNTVIDALLFSLGKVVTHDIFPEQLTSVYKGDQRESKVILVTCHRRENFGTGFKSICTAIKSLALRHPDVIFVYPVHLNPNVKGPVMGMLGNVRNILLIDPLGYPEFVSLMNRSYLILTDSGGVQEEGPTLGKPVLVMRENTERPEALEGGTVALVGTEHTSIVAHVDELLNDQDQYNLMLGAKNPYGDGKSAERILNIIRQLT